MDYSIQGFSTLGNNFNQTTYYTPYDAAAYTADSYGWDTYSGTADVTVVPECLRATGTMSLQEISAQVFDNVRYEETETQYYHTMRRARPTDPAVGELVPVGDAVLPLLACAMVYVMIIHKRLKRQK